MSRKKVVLYEFIRERMEEQTDLRNYEITNDKAKDILGKQFRIPRWLQAPVINEMIEVGYLDRIDKFKILIKVENGGRK
jgi:hypothetical protein